MKVSINFSVNPELDDEGASYEVKKVLKELADRVSATRYDNGANYTIYNDNGNPIGKMSVSIDL
jgi:hypothetical protein